jgi:hypothetical protein
MMPPVLVDDVDVVVAVSADTDEATARLGQLVEQVVGARVMRVVEGPVELEVAKATFSAAATESRKAA